MADESTTPEPMRVSVLPPSHAVLLASANTELQMAKDYVIDSQSMYELAAADLGALKSSVKKLDEQRLGIKRPLMDAMSKIDELFTQPIALRKQAVQIIETSMLAYRREEERKAEEERRKREEAARIERERLRKEAEEATRKAEQEAAETRRKAQEEADRLRREAEADAERIRKEAEERAAKVDDLAEAERIQNEANERAERERREAEERAAAEQRTADQRASEIVADGQSEAAALSTSAAVMTAPVLPGYVPAASNTSVRTTWKAKVTSLDALVKAVAEGKAPIGLIKADETALNRMATALKESMKVPGVESYPQQGVTSRRAA